MNGIMIILAGIGLIGFSIILFVISIVYRKTAGKKIREELMKEYE